LRAIINVEDARKAAHFLSMTSASGGWRVVIVDTADEMNAAAANAILKILEEPPANSVFLMVSHAPGRLLPTIRSRCLHLPMRPLSEEQVREALALLDTGLDAQALERAAALSGGSPGRALELASSRAAEFFARFRNMAEGGAPYDRALTLSIAESLTGARNADDFKLFSDLLGEWITLQARESARLGHHGAAGGWAALSAEMADLLGRVEGFNLDRRQALSMLFSRCEAIARAG
jgi:DNA polymerase-3 subunit delta'